MWQSFHPVLFGHPRIQRSKALWQELAVILNVLQLFRPDGLLVLGREVLDLTQAGLVISRPPTFTPIVSFFADEEEGRLGRFLA